MEWNVRCPMLRVREIRHVRWTTTYPRLGLGHRGLISHIAVVAYACAARCAGLYNRTIYSTRISG